LELAVVRPDVLLVIALAREFVLLAFRVLGVGAIGLTDGPWAACNCPEKSMLLCINVMTEGVPSPEASRAVIKLTESLTCWFWFLKLKLTNAWLLMTVLLGVAALLSCDKLERVRAVKSILLAKIPKTNVLVSAEVLRTAHATAPPAEAGGGGCVEFLNLKGTIT